MTDITALTPAHRRLIEALAQAVVQDYLRAQAAPSNDPGAAQQNPVALPPVDKAA